MTIVRPADIQDVYGWAALRRQLWEEVDVAEHAAEAAAQLCDESGRFLNLLAFDEDRIVAFAEASLRHEYVNGCDHSPVLFLEGIFVLPPYRKRGIARLLCERARAWGQDGGCREFASDAWFDDDQSHAFHRALGFVETEMVVYFRQQL